MTLFRTFKNQTNERYSGVKIAVLKIRTIQKAEKMKTIHFWKKQKLEKKKKKVEKKKKHWEKKRQNSADQQKKMKAKSMSKQVVIKSASIILFLSHFQLIC